MCADGNFERSLLRFACVFGLASWRIRPRCSKTGCTSRCAAVAPYKTKQPCIGPCSICLPPLFQQLQAATYRVKHDFWALRSKTPPPGAANPVHQQHAGQDLGEPYLADVQPSVIVQQRSARGASAAVDGHAEVEDAEVLDGGEAAMDLVLGESDEQGTADEDMDDGTDSGAEDLVEGTAEQEQGLQQVHRNQSQPLQELDGEEGNPRLLVGTAAGSTGGGSEEMPCVQGKGAEAAGVRQSACGDTALGRQPANSAPADHQVHSVSAGGTRIEPFQRGLGVLAGCSAARTAASTAVDTSASDMGLQPSLVAEPAYSPTEAPGTAAEPGTGGPQVWREERTLHQVQQSPAGYRQHGLQPVRGRSGCALHGLSCWLHASASAFSGVPYLALLLAPLSACPPCLPCFTKHVPNALPVFL